MKFVVVEKLTWTTEADSKEEAVENCQDGRGFFKTASWKAKKFLELKR